MEARVYGREYGGTRSSVDLGLYDERGLDLGL